MATPRTFQQTENVPTNCHAVVGSLFDWRYEQANLIGRRLCAQDDLAFPGDDMALRVHPGTYTISAALSSQEDAGLTAKWTVPNAARQEL